MTKKRAKTKNKTVKAFKKLVKTKKFSRFYVITSLVILGLTTLLWSILSAKLQQNNSDQLVNSYLFNNAATFHGATLPATHTFLMKWPLFWLVHILGDSGGVFNLLTVLISLVTVGFLAYILRRIEKRPLVFGTLILALASVLLAVPAQPYASGILPINIAMLTTRNLEYVLYIASLMALIRWPQLKKLGFWLGLIGLGILIASDKLFLPLSLGGAVLALIAYSAMRYWEIAKLCIKWLLMSLGASGLAAASLWWINFSGLTHIATQASTSPYGLSHNGHNLGLAIIYGVSGLLTNFGANPAYDALELKHVPTSLGHNLISPGGPAFILNFLIFGGLIYLSGRLLLSSFKHPKKPQPYFKLSIILLWTSVAAAIAFVATNHYYPVDARYLTIAVFAIFISAATFISTQKRLRFKPERIVLAGAVICIGIIFGLFAALHNYNSENKSMELIHQRSLTIVQILRNHPVHTLVGDYWRVLPAKLASQNSINVTPLSNCTQLREVLSSEQWQPDLGSNSFAYLLSFDEKFTDYPSCTIDQVAKDYGRPNSTVLVAGTLKDPKEMLVFYDHGINKPAKPPTTPLANTILPIRLDQLKNTSCNATIMNLVAHQDDDLLFMNPDLLHSIKANNCVRTVYVTAGDGGGNKFYWLAREQGSEAAYAEMLGIQNPIWLQRTVTLNNHEFLTIVSPRGASRVSLIFLHLPDGNLRGNGFKSSNYESLSKLESGAIKQIQTVDGQSYYSYKDLVSALLDLVDAYQPDVINTLTPDNGGVIYPDHKDHSAVGHAAETVYAQYKNRSSSSIKFYIGYSINQMPENVSGDNLRAKQAAFFEYAKFDGAVCASIDKCNQATYGLYLPRQYMAQN